MKDFNNLQAKLDNKNLELKALIKEIEELGGTIQEGKIIAPKEKIYVLESYFYAASQYESSGRYRIIRQIRKLDEVLVEQLKALRGEEEEVLKEFFLGFWEEYEDDLASGIYCVEYGNGYIDEENIQYITNDEEEYVEGELLLEVNLTTETGEWHGYMSFFEMDIEDYNKFKEIDIEFCKCLTYN